MTMESFLCGGPHGGDDNDETEIDEQPTQPIIIKEIPLPYDAETWPEISELAVEFAALDMDALIQNAAARIRDRPCVVCDYRRALDGETIEIGPEPPLLCDGHRHILDAASPADWVAMHQIYRRIYDWWHAPPSDEYSS
jgi:hypothetical protein